MRISDWSSDVCSSYLARPPGTHCPSLPLNAVSRAPRHCLQNEALRNGGLQSRKLPIAAGSKRQRLSPSLSAGQRVVRRVSTASTSGAEGQGGPAITVAVGTKVRRSGVNTTEVQLLMRQEYVSLC